jgi:hypothetical protein
MFAYLAASWTDGSIEFVMIILVLFSSLHILFPHRCLRKTVCAKSVLSEKATRHQFMAELYESVQDVPLVD